MRQFILCSILLTLTFCSYGRQDSLWNIWNDQDQPDSSRLDAIDEIIWQDYLFTQPDSAYYYAQVYFDFADQLNLDTYRILAVRIQGISYSVRGQNDSAIVCFNRSLEIAKSTGNKPQIAAEQGNLGNVYYRIGRYEEAINHLAISLSIYKELNNKEKIAVISRSISRITLVQGDFLKTIDYLFTSLNAFEELDNEPEVGAVYFILGTVYEELGDCEKSLEYSGKYKSIAEKYNNTKGIAYAVGSQGACYLKMGDLNQALKSFRQCLTISEEIQDKRGAANSLYDIGNVFKQRELLDSARSYFEASKLLRDETGDLDGISASMTAIADINYRQGKYTEAIKGSEEALKIARQIGNLKTTGAASENLYLCYKEAGEIAKALQMHELFMKVQDSISHEENKRAVFRNEYRYAYDQKAFTDSVSMASERLKSLNKLERSRTMNFALVGGLSLSMVFLIILFNRFRITRKQKRTIAEKNEAVVTAMDKLKETQNKLIQNEKMASLGQLTAGIAHEINNPVNFTRTSSFALDQDLKELRTLVDKYKLFIQKGKGSVEEIQSFEKQINVKSLMNAIDQEIRSIKEGTKRTSEIVKGLREFTFTQKEGMRLANINEGIETTLSLIKSKFIGKITLIKKFDPSIGMVFCHISQINQVVLNILSNAYDAVEGKGEIRVSTKNLGKVISISICDNGMGISEKNQEKIFDPFFTTKEIGEGSGLGLYICHEIIKNHNGSIEVKSLPGKETCFEIQIPNLQEKIEANETTNSLHR